MRAGDTVLVTGGTGFVGSAVLRALGGRGLKLRALARAASARGNLAGVDCEIAVGDMTDPAAMAAASAGARFVFHVAADYRLWARDPASIMRANVAGTRTVMEAARAAGAQKIVYTSSVATLNAGRAAIDETAPLADGEGIGVYKRSKVAAERLVERMIAEGLPAVIVLPSTPIGPRDIKPTPTGRIVVEAAAGRIPAFVDTGLNLAHVDDVAAGHLLALERGRVGERYILGGQDASLRQLLADIAALAGRRAADHPTASRTAVSPDHRRRDRGPLHREGAHSHPGRSEHGGAPNVLHLGKGGAGIGLPRPALPGRPERRLRLVQGGGVHQVSLAIACAALAAWLYLLVGRGMFWRGAERDDLGAPPEPAAWPEVTAVVPARDEADVVGQAMTSLRNQDYPGRFRIILVDDNSADGTGRGRPRGATGRIRWR